MSTYRTLERHIHRDDAGLRQEWYLHNPRFEGNHEYASCRAYVAADVNRSPVSTIRTLPAPAHTSWRVPEHDNDSFTKIRQSGRIKMTRYSTGTIDEIYHLVEIRGDKVSRSGSWTIHLPSTNRDYAPFYFGTTFGYHPGSNSNMQNRIAFPYPTPVLEYTDVSRRDYRDFANWELVDIRQQDLEVETVIESLKGDVASKLFQKWDALTEAFEMRDTFAMAKDLLRAAKKPLQTARAELQHLKSIGATDKSIRDRWLQLRYGILPTMYSVKDVSELLAESGNKYLTERSRRSIRLSSDFQSVPRTECRFVSHTGLITVNATGKACFSSPSARLWSGISLNPFQTAWELTPYSFVIDWFCNAGDWIYNRSSALAPSNLDSEMCYSVRVEKTTREYVRIETSPGSFHDFLLSEKFENTYDRIPFTQNDIKLVLDVKFKSWKRWFDAYALSVDPLIKALRRLS